LQERSLKETIGLAHQNLASVYSQEEKFQKAVDTYYKAVLYLKEDPWILELLGYHLLFANHEAEGRAILEKVRYEPIVGAVLKDTLIEDYLSGKVDKEGLLAVFQHIDDTRASIILKKERLELVLQRYPAFRAGWLQLATAYLQLHKPAEALETLEKAHLIDETDPTVEYYLAALYLERFDWKKARRSYHLAEQVLTSKNYHPKALKELKTALDRIFPV
jgi:Tfp pilus assembly protein PilF